MGKRKLKTVFWVFLLLIVTGLIGCKQKEPEKEQLCHIVIEKGDGYQVTDPVRTIKSGSNVSFTVTLDNNWQILGTDYHGETEIIKDDDGKTVEIVLHEVKYSESICIQAEKGKYEMLYDANGGFRQSEHLLSRYSPENQYFNRNGSLFQKGLHTAWMEYQG